jgi:hypothetical protein
VNVERNPFGEGIVLLGKVLKGILEECNDNILVYPFLLMIEFIKLCYTYFITLLFAHSSIDGIN